MSENHSQSRRFILLGFVLAFCLMCLLGTAALRASRGRDVALPAATPVANRVQNGTELVAIYVTSSECGASRDPTLVQSIRTIRRRIADEATDQGKHVVWIGAALDLTPEKGIAFLAPFGPFDEIVAGGSWLNTASLDFMVRGLAGQLSTPQLILVERDVMAEKTDLKVSPDRLVLRLVSASRIHSFAAEKAAGGND